MNNAMNSERHVVVLNWGVNGVTPVPDPVFLNPYDTLAFEIGEAPAGGELRVTFDSARCFSRLVYEHADARGDIVVTSALPGPVPYQCDLLVNGEPQARVPKGHGGTGQPGGGGSKTAGLA